MCNEKYYHDEVCRTPAVTEQIIKKAFLIAINRIPNREDYCAEFESEIMPLIGDTSVLEKRKAELKDELNEAVQAVNHLILDNSKKAQDQFAYERRYNELNNRVEEKKEMIQSVQEEISKALCRKENARIFLRGLRSLKGKDIIKEFDISTWHALVDYVKVMPDKTITFYFRNGNSETVRLVDAR